MHSACFKNNSVALRALLALGANPNLPAASGETPLQYAVRSNAVPLVKRREQNRTGAGEENRTREEKEEKRTAKRDRNTSRIAERSLIINTRKRTRKKVFLMFS